MSNDALQEEILDNAVDRTEAALIVTQRDNGDALEAGWSCSYDDGRTLLRETAAASIT